MNNISKFLYTDIMEKFRYVILSG